MLDKSKKLDVGKLETIAKEIRRDILLMLEQAGSGHTGGSLSIVEILIVLYYCKMKHNPKNPKWQKRDKFILSKGHGCPALYAVLANLGYFPQEDLLTLRKLGSGLQGHPRYGLPGIETSSGSLGQGLSIACGMALAARMDNMKNKIYCLMGDGELDEGQIWEAAMTAAHYNLSNLCGIIDYNKYQIDGKVCDVMNIKSIPDVWRSFGWNVEEVDGHNIKALFEVFNKVDNEKKKPSLIIAHTIKGKGVSFIEKDNRWHGVAPRKNELERALKELDLE